jgi:SAM-dependent methyltransferase
MRSLSEQLLRLQRIEPFLRCPQCGGKLIRQGDEAYKSESCGAKYAIDHGVPILLLHSLTAQGLGKPLPPDQHASTHPYSPGSDELIAKFAAGLVLDLGAGGKHIERTNVVQVDVFRFPMVDVVASADALPFRADTFDAVISQAVFEHLQYPDAAAAEVLRVLKPDGMAKIDTAFLQPEHAYPHHYFNATEAGLRHWFRDFELQWSGVEAYQHPKWALLWFLDVYLAALPPDAQEKVLPISLRNCVAMLKQLQAGTMTGFTGELEFCHALDTLAPESVRKLAAGVSVKAVKRVTSAGLSRPNGQEPIRQLELERRLQIQQDIATQDAEYKQKILQICSIGKNVTEFLLHEYELNRQDPLVNPGFLRPLQALVVRELRKHLPDVWWLTLRQYYRKWKGIHPKSVTVPAATPKAAISFWCCPQTPVDLLNQFFSLVHQTNGDWMYLLEASPHHSAAMRRLIWELQQRDARVCVLPEEAIKAHLLSTASVELPSDTVLAFDAVEELITLLQEHPKLKYVTSDVERWCSKDTYPIRCWGINSSEDGKNDVDSEFDFSGQMLVLVNLDGKSYEPQKSKHLNNYAHIPKVLYRIMPFSQA